MATRYVRLPRRGPRHLDLDALQRIGPGLPNRLVFKSTETAYIWDKWLPCEVVVAVARFRLGLPA